MKRETGESPVRTRRCNGGALFWQDINLYNVTGLSTGWEDEMK